MATEAEEKLTGKLGDVLNDKTESPRRQVSLRLTVIARLQRNNFDRLVTELNVTRSQWAMIAVVARYPGSTQRTIAEYLEMSEASAGRLIDRLCADGLLERRDRRDDRRARSVYVTDAAHPLLDKLGLIAAEAEGRMFHGFSDDEVEQLRDYLSRIYDNVSRG
ncbi:MarR family transcriptional regulator [Novosphingobium sp. BL-8H]|uniref:MarR family winged helix-turn-helix transcriptional regulator n=1 Tax=Novosphingobium sp. BL-8H TaxID=3127640 RepID=UPI003756A184